MFACFPSLYCVIYLAVSAGNQKFACSVHTHILLINFQNITLKNNFYKEFCKYILSLLQTFIYFYLLENNVWFSALEAYMMRNMMRGTIRSLAQHKENHYLSCLYFFVEIINNFLFLP